MHGNRVAAILVIAIGVLFLLQNLGIITGDIWRIFWPIAVIAVGVGMLTKGHWHA